MVWGRDSQREYLEQFYERGGSQLIVLYGGKGTGKTSLVGEFLRDREYCYYQARSCSDKEQLRLWAAECSEMGIDGLTDDVTEEVTYDGIAKKLIHELGSGQKAVLVFDEFQNMVKSGRDFMRNMVRLLHHEWSSRDVLIILCSSCIGWVENSMVTRIGEAAFEISGFLKLKELGFAELYHYFDGKVSAQECETIYSIMGGVPGCFTWIDTGKSLKENICRLFLQKDAALFREARELVESQLREAGVYHTILAALAAGSNKLNDLYHVTGFSRAKISVYLRNLMEFEIVEKVFSFDSEGRDNTQKGIYRIQNHLVRFYFRFLYPHLSALSLMTPEAFYDKYIADELSAYTADYFGEICAQYLEQENQKGKLAANYVRSGEWVGKMGSLDWVAQSESGRTLICGCHYDDPVMPYQKYEEWMECVQAAKLPADEVYLFAREGFDERLLAFADENEKVHTIAWRNLYI